MFASWNLLPFQMLLLLLSRRGINTIEQPAQTHPLLVSNPNSTDVKTWSMVIKGKNHTEKIEVLKPTNLELECTLASDIKLPNITSYWKKDGKETNNSRLIVQLENEQYNLKRAFNITGEDGLGNYSCVFDGEAHGDFIVAAPQMGDVRDKPIVGYVGDSVVLICKMEKPVPNTWTWYRANGTNKEELIDTGSEPLRYEIKNDQGKTRLKVHNLSEADSGPYYCGAVYDISTSISHVELSVITYMEPLKPFIAIVVEVLILVIIILLCEKSNSKSVPASGDEANADQTDKLTQGESNGTEESSTVRQRKA